jgi:hypothetical protein
MTKVQLASAADAAVLTEQLHAAARETLAVRDIEESA